MNEPDLTTKISGIDVDILKKIGLKEISFAASADTKITVAQYESMGVFASMGMTFNIDALTGELPIDEIINKVVLPLRNSFVQFSHPETLTRINELRAVVEGIRDGRPYAEIARRVDEERAKTLTLMRESFSRG